MRLVQLNILWLILLVGSCGEKKQEDQQKDKIVYVQNQLLFSEFDMTKDLKKEFDNIIKQRNMKLDSIQLRMKAIEGSVNGSSMDEQVIAQYQQLQNNYMQQYKQFEESNKILENQHFDSVWKRLNAYVQEFSEKEGYTFVLGATGNGNLMYANEGKDITQDLVKYCNNKYKGN